MNTYLLSWNPKRWNWEELHDLSYQVKAGKSITRRWSCGNNKQPRINDRAFLIRLGQEPKGIFASGIILEGSYEDIHWDDEKAAIGKTSLFVQLQFDMLLDPNEDDILSRDVLQQPPLSEMHWDAQMSGVRIPINIAHELEKQWLNITSDNNYSLPNEIDPKEKIFEGAVQQILVNSYERSPLARLKCINYYGKTCFICGFDFAKTYGDVGKDFIHVHHLKQLAEIGENYQIDPIQDLRPVCPNCHAILHKRKPPYTLDEVKSFMHPGS
jgi:5-methylcytosine-specific restriction protein A